ncbi:MAG TPA: FG-GAP-like repeat-containing protein [Gammaproteobacteria bacterium]
MHSRRHLPGYALGLAALAYCGLAGANGLYPVPFFGTLDTPGAVALADVNGDGHLDVVEIGEIGTMAVLLNDSLGKGKFSSPTSYYFGGANPVALAVADLNGDGKPDVVLADNDGANVMVMIGKGDGTFVAQTAAQATTGKGTPAPTYPTGAGPFSVAVADVNGDGSPDIVTANFTDNDVSVLLNKGDGTFKGQATYATGLSPTYVAIADLNDNGPDILVANTGESTLGVLRNKGDGTFAAQTATTISGPPTTSTVQTIAAADFDGDGKVDVVITNTDPNGTTVIYEPGEGRGRFGQSRSFTAGPQPRYVQALDADGDGHLDLLTGSIATGLLRVLKGNGQGGFHAGVYYPAAGINSGLAVQPFATGDVDGDGNPDIVAINPAGSFIQVLHNDGSGGFPLQGSYATGAVPSDVKAADLDGDGHADVVEVDSADGTLGVRLGNGDGTLRARQVFSVGGTGTHPQRLALADLDGDGKLDAVCANNGDGTVSVLLGNGDGSFQTARQFAAGDNPVDLAVEDMDGDGKPDLIVANAVVNKVSILPGHGGGGFGAPRSFAAGGVISALAVGDANRDHIPDVVTVGSNVAILVNDGGGKLQPVTFDENGASSFVYAGVGVRAALADLDHSGFPDIIVADYGNSRITVLRSHGKRFDAAFSYSTCTNPSSLAVADLNADGDPDVVTTCVGSSSVGVLLGNGQGGLISNSYPAEVDARGVAVADFDENGQPDLAVINGGSDDLNISLQIPGVVAADTAPVAKSGPFFIRDGTQPLSGTFNASDKDGDGLSFSVLSPATHGALSFGGGSFTYFANTGYIGKDSFTFQASDGVKLSNIATTNVTVQNNNTGGGGGGGFLGGFWLPLLPLLLGVLGLRRRRG